MAKNTLKANWESYAETVLQGNVPPEVISQHQKSYYAGAAVTMALVSHAVNTDDEPAYLALRAEVKGYAYEVLDELLQATMKEKDRH